MKPGSKQKKQAGRAAKKSKKPVDISVTTKNYATRSKVTPGYFKRLVTDKLRSKEKGQRWSAQAHEELKKSKSPKKGANTKARRVFHEKPKVAEVMRPAMRTPSPASREIEDLFNMLLPKEKTAKELAAEEAWNRQEAIRLAAIPIIGANVHRVRLAAQDQPPARSKQLNGKKGSGYVPLQINYQWQEIIKSELLPQTTKEAEAREKQIAENMTMERLKDSAKNIHSLWNISTLPSAEEIRKDY